MSVEIGEAARSAVRKQPRGTRASCRKVQFPGRANGGSADRTDPDDPVEEMADAPAESRDFGYRAPVRQSGPHPGEEPHRPHSEPAASPFRSRIAGNIRQAAAGLVPNVDSPRFNEPRLENLRMDWAAGERRGQLGTAARSAVTPVAGARRVRVVPGAGIQTSVGGQAAARQAAVHVTAARAASVNPGSQARGSGKDVPGFDAWKRQFMQDGEPLDSALPAEPETKSETVVCPRCYSTHPSGNPQSPGFASSSGRTCSAPMPVLCASFL